MSRIVWDASGTREYESGVSCGVLYPMGSNSTYSAGVAWNGLTGVTESPDGAEATDLWADNIKYASLRSAEKFGGTIEAYMYPDEFKPCNGEVDIATGASIGQQTRTKFGFCYRTEIGSDTNPNKGYKLHIVYGAMVTPSERAYETINDSPDAITFSWEFDTTPVEVTGFKPTALVVVDSTTADSTKLGTLEDILYGKDASGGSEATTPRLPLPDEIKSTLT